MFNRNTIQMPGANIFNNRVSSSVAPIFTVTSLQEVQVAQPNYDGTPSFFYVLEDRTIVVKQMDLSGLVVLKTYKEVPPSNTTLENSNSSTAATSASPTTQTPTLEAEISKIAARLDKLEKSLNEIKQVKQSKNIEIKQEENINGMQPTNTTGQPASSNGTVGDDRRKSELF